MTNPILISLKQARFAHAVAVVVILGFALWSFWPVKPLPIDTPNVVVALDDRKATGSDASDEPLDMKVFTARLWNPPPPPEVHEPQTAAKAPAALPLPSPLNVQLIGITTQQDRRIAALYDADADKVVFVSDGQRVRGYTVVQVAESNVELSDGRVTKRLRLREES